jgi:hypothetical protein
MVVEDGGSSKLLLAGFSDHYTFQAVLVNLEGI